MPVSHIGLTVSHLPTSCSFFLSALQPLGYRFIGQQGNQIGLGIRDADFFLCQESPGVKAGAAHIAFTAHSRTAVRDFYTAALTAGGRPNGAPANRTGEEEHFNAAILDFDGNSIEVVYRNGPDIRDDGTVMQHSRVITWRRTVTESIRDDRSVVSSRTSKPASVVAPPASVAPSQDPFAASGVSKAASLVRSLSEPCAVPQAPAASAAPAPTVTAPASNGDSAAKTIIGTLLGAAAGAAITYAMCKSERDSAKKEAEFEAFQLAKAALQTATAQTNSESKLSMQDPHQIYETTPRSVVHRNINDTNSQYAPAQARSVYVQGAIEPAPQSYVSQSYPSAPPSRISERRAIEYVPQQAIEYAPSRQAIEYLPAPSAAPSRSQFTAHRSMTSPELSTVSKAKSTASRAHSVAHSAAPSTLISSFVADKEPKRSDEESVYSHHTSRSKARSHVSRHTSASKHGSKAESRTPSPPPSTIKSKAASIVGSILGRDNESHVSKRDNESRVSKSSRKKHSSDDDNDEFEIGDLDLDDNDTVVPSDSISQISTSRRRRHRSHKDRDSSSQAGTSVSKHSSASKHSKHSRHTHHSSSSRKSSHSKHGGSSVLTDEWWDTDDHIDSKRPSVVSESSDVSTVKPVKSRTSRKDSVAGKSEYDDMFNGVSYGDGGVASIPIRGITPSMVAAQTSNKNRGMINYAHGQRMKPFGE